ncbi:RNA-binding protein 4B [Merluccius polli]|uniref:RNA-binding protein 4B n=1 Tax=Merluccius polli TaxID=89951 RepID=A0AA47N5I2_MERPO|nr:RNA-binding protein 4B [Merluccius polli]
MTRLSPRAFCQQVARELQERKRRQRRLLTWTTVEDIITTIPPRATMPTRNHPHLARVRLIGLWTGWGCTPVVHEESRSAVTMVKIFIGNIAQEAGKDELEALFTPYGQVTECAKYKNYAFVHMDDRKSATKAIRELHGHKLHGRPINVEPSLAKNNGPVKLHIANVEKGHDDELRALFEEYGDVSECAIIKNFAFVHMRNSEEAMDAIKGLDNTEFQGKRIHVQMSRNPPRGGEEEEEYPPPPMHRGGYFPPRPYPGDHPDMHYRGRMHGYPPPPPPPPPPRRPAYPEHGYGERDGYNVVDYYEKYRARPYAAAPYPPAAPPAYPAPPSYATPPSYAPPAYMDRRAAPIPPPPPSARERPYDPYDGRALAPPPPSSAGGGGGGGGAASSYYTRDRSPIRRTPLPAAPPPSGNGYSYERSRLSPVPRGAIWGSSTAAATLCWLLASLRSQRETQGLRDVQQHLEVGLGLALLHPDPHLVVAELHQGLVPDVRPLQIFVGNLPREADQEEIEALFKEHGTVTECSIIKNFAFVHMDDRKAATKAIKTLHLHKLHGSQINVEASHGKNQGAVKLHVANVEKGDDGELRALFEEYGSVSECAVVKNFAFVHMCNSEEAMDAIKGLDNTEFQGKRIHVQISKSRPRHEEQDDYPPQDGGYWPPPPRYPGDRHEPPPPPPNYMRGPHPPPHHHMPPGYPTPPPPPPPPRRAGYGERPYEREREAYGVVDYYEKYRARPYGMPAYDDRRPGAIPPPPPPPSAVVRERILTAPLDPYDRRALPPTAILVLCPRPQPPPPGAAPPHAPRRQWLRLRAAPPPPYGVVHRPRDPYAERLPPPPPARYAY